MSIFTRRQRRANRKLRITRRNKKICIAGMTSSCLRFQFHVCSYLAVRRCHISFEPSPTQRRACVSIDIRFFRVPPPSTLWLSPTINRRSDEFRSILSNFTPPHLRRTEPVTTVSFVLIRFNGLSVSLTTENSSDV